MGLIFSYDSVDQRLKTVERIVVDLDKQLGSLKTQLRTLETLMEKNRLTFQWSERTTLFDPTKVEELQMENAFDIPEDEEDKIQTQEEMEKHRVYKFRVVHNHCQYMRQFRDKDEFQEFKTRFAQWGGSRFAHLAAAE